MARGTDAYAGAARLGRELAREGLTVATGGGPGAMEAANLGAYAAPFDAATLTDALRLLAKAPTFTPSVTDWARAAFEVRATWPGGGPSVGIPTWFYGHEPPNPFAAHIAKYFSNARAPPGPYRRSSTTRRPTTTSRGASRRRWCWSTGSTGHGGCPPDLCCVPSPGSGRWSPVSPSLTGSRRLPRH